MTKVRANKDVLGAMLFAAVAVSLYSFWGAHLLAGNPEAPVAAVEQNIR